MTSLRFFAFLLTSSIFPVLGSCAYMSQPGPQKGAFKNDSTDYRLVSVHSRADLPINSKAYGKAEVPPRIKGGAYSDKIRERDSLRFAINDLSELSPFYTRGELFNFGPIEVPQDGRVSIPYVGEIQVIDRTLAEISSELNEKVKPISKTAQASVGRSGRIPHTANIVGEVKNPGPVMLEKADITSHDLLAVSGGPTQSEFLYQYILRRGGRDYAFDYLGFRQHEFPIESGDMLSINSDKASRFYVMGAINRPTTVPFPVASPTLADALGAASGFDERRSDPSGVFVFRKGNPDTIYTINLKDPQSMLLTQRFPILGEDLVYVTEAPLTRWNRLISQLLPVSQLTQAAYNLDRINAN